MFLIDGIKFRVHADGQIYYSKKFNEQYSRLLNKSHKYSHIQVPANIKSKIVESEDGVSAKEAFYAYSSFGRFLPTRESSELLKVIASQIGVCRDSRAY